MSSVEYGQTLLPLPPGAHDSIYASNSPRRFKLPPLDGCLTIPELYEWHYIHNPSHSVFVYEDQVSRVGYCHLTYADIVQAAHRAARYIGERLGIDVDNHVGDIPPIAVLSTSDTATAFCAMLGMMLAEIPMFIISPQNPVSTVAYLLEQSGASKILISGEEQIRALCVAACAAMKANQVEVTVVIPRFEDIFMNAAFVPVKARNLNRSRPVVFSHSSGSTALPKAIPWTHPFLLQSGVAPLHGSHNFCGALVSWHGISMSHGTGIHLLTWVPTSGMIIGILPPRFPAQTAPADVVFEGYKRLRPDYLIAFPHYIETWSRDAEKVEQLKEATGVIFAGGFLNIAIGNELVSRGVKLYPLFGMAEAGVVGSFLPPYQGIDWEYFTLTPHSGGQFIDAGDDYSELIIVKSPIKDIQVVNTKFGDSDAFSSGDLFVEHPGKPGYWKCVGRMAHRIVNSAGEKTDPALFEHALGKDPRVRSAVVFGHGRTHNGILLELSEDNYFDPKDLISLHNFREEFRPMLEETNKIVSIYSQVSPQMIITTSSTKPFAYTEKGSLKRTIALEVYKSEIDALYHL